MEKSDAVSDFARAFVQVHLASALVGLLVTKTHSLFYGLFAFLASVHVFAAVIHWADVRSITSLYAVTFSVVRSRMNEIWKEIESGKSYLVFM